MTVEQTSTPPQTTVGSAPFRDLCALSDESDGTYGAVIDKVWTIGKKVHGGAMLAICAAAARRRIREGDGEEVLLQPIAVSADFARHRLEQQALLSPARSR